MAKNKFFERIRDSMEEGLEILTLSNRDRDSFLASLKSDREPSERIKKAAQEYKKKVTSDAGEILYNRYIKGDPKREASFRWQKVVDNLIDGIMADKALKEGNFMDFKEFLREIEKEKRK